MNSFFRGVVYACSFVFFLSIAPVATEASGIYGENGWSTALSEVVGDDTSCGADQVLLEVYLRDLQTGNPATVDSVVYGVFDQAGGATSSSVIGSGPEVGTLCFNPDTQFFGFDVYGGSGYHDFSVGYLWATPGAIPRGKRIRATAWLTPSSVATPEYIETSPVNITTNTSPTYQVSLDSFPATYGATGLSRILLFVYDYDLATGAVGTRRVSSIVATGGGSGTVTAPAQSLADGVYTWGFYLSLNGSHDAGGVTPIYELSTGFGGAKWPFILDTTGPGFGPETGHVPASPDSLDTVGITATATDALSGVDEIRIYVDSILTETCAYASVSSATCNVSVGPYAASTTHEYYAVATDAAGNVTTGATHSFTVQTPRSDLSAGGVTPITATIQTPVSLLSTIQNSGNEGTSVGFTVLFQKVLDVNDSAGITDIGTYSSAVLGVAESNSASLSYTFPVGDAGTIQNIRVCADQSSAIDAGIITETDETNNCGAWTAVTVAGLPDLVAASSTVSVGTVNAGDIITFGTGGLSNPYQATYPVTTRFPHAGFYIDANNDGVSEYTAQIVPGGPTASILAWLTQNKTVAWTVPANVPSGTYRVGYIANEPAGFSEVSYTNNWSGWTAFTVVGNTPPIADAGEDTEITLPVAESAPTGVSASDPDGSPASYLWSFISGPGPTPTIVDSTTPNPVFQGLSAAGTYVFRFAVTDNLGAVTTDDMQVVVNEDPAPTGWITATPNVVDAVDTSTITWGSTNALGCDVSNTQNDDDWSGTSNAVGEVTSPLTVNTSYVLTCDGVLVASAPITVNPDVTITASSKVVQSGGYVDITWNTNGNDEAACNLSGGGLTDTLFNGTGTGTHRVPDITAKTTFTITCGSQTDGVDVEVKPIGWES